MRRSLLLTALFAVFLRSSLDASIILLNGSFENIEVTDLGSGLRPASDWTNKSGLLIQASSAPAGFESTPTNKVTGSRYLRLASDDPDPTFTGFIVQNLGTMVAGETYTITGDLLGGAGVTPFSLLARFTSDGTNTPAFTYASQTTSALGRTTFSAGGLSLVYTATGADDGQSLFLSLRALPSGPGQARRGGVDNLVLLTNGTPVPEPGTVTLVGIAGLALVFLRR